MMKNLMMIDMNKELTISELIEVLSKSFTEEEKKKVKIYIASDEELNSVYKVFQIGFPIDKSKKYAIIYGLKGTELQ